MKILILRKLIFLIFVFTSYHVIATDYLGHGLYDYDPFGWVSGGSAQEVCDHWADIEELSTIPTADGGCDLYQDGDYEGVIAAWCQNRQIDISYTGTSQVILNEGGDYYIYTIDSTLQRWPDSCEDFIFFETRTEGPDSGLRVVAYNLSYGDVGKWGAKHTNSINEFKVFYPDNSYFTGEQKKFILKTTQLYPEIYPPNLNLSINIPEVEFIINDDEPTPQFSVTGRNTFEQNETLDINIKLDQFVQNDFLIKLEIENSTKLTSPIFSAKLPYYNEQADFSSLTTLDLYLGEIDLTSINLTSSPLVSFNGEEVKLNLIVSLERGGRVYSRKSKIITLLNSEDEDSECYNPFYYDDADGCIVKCPVGSSFDPMSGSCVSERVEPNKCLVNVLNPINALTSGKEQAVAVIDTNGAVPLKFNLNYSTANDVLTKNEEVRRRYKLNTDDGEKGWNIIKQPDGYKGPQYKNILYENISGQINQRGNGFWSHRYDYRLYEVDEQNIYIKIPDNNLIRFSKNYDAYNEVIKKGELLVKNDTEGWLYTSLENVRYNFDSDGYLIKVFYPNSQWYQLNYNEQRKLTVIENLIGNKIELTYDNDLLVSITANEVENYVLGYDALNNLKFLTYPNGTAKEFHYENDSFPFYLTGITDENGVRSATWKYDQDGRAVYSAHADGVDAGTVSYSSDQSISIDANGKQRVLLFDSEIPNQIKSIEGSGCDSEGNDSVINYSYDSYGRVIEKVDQNSIKTHYTYNSRGLRASITKLYGTDLAKTTSFLYENDNIVEPTKITLENGTVIESRYSDLGLLLSRSVKTSSEVRTTIFEYDDKGMLLLVDGPRSDVNDITTYQYYENGNLKQIENALGHKIIFNQYDTAGRVTEFVDENGKVSSFAYDIMGKITTFSQEGRTYTYSYDAVGNLIEVNNGLGAVYYLYDSANRLITIKDDNENKIDYEYDTANNLLGIKNEDKSGELLYTLRYLYDTVGRISRVTLDESNSIDYKYDAYDNLIETIDPTSNSLIDVYNQLNDKIKSVDQAENETSYNYSNGKLISVTDALGRETMYEYNGFGDVTRTISPDTGETTFQYDEAGNLIAKQDARGILVQYNYDNLNRVTSIKYPDESENVTFEYDNVSESQNGIGLLTKVTEPTGVTEFFYTPHGEIKETKFMPIGAGFVQSVKYNFNNVGNLSQQTYPSGMVVNYSHDSNGNVISISAQKNNMSTVIATNLDYLPYGPLNYLEYGNGLVLEQSFDRAYRLTNKKVTDTYDKEYSYNYLNIQSIDDLLNSSLSQSFEYDLIDRLTNSQGRYGDLRYSYDNIGNRTSKAVNSVEIPYSYSEGVLNSVNGVSRSYDPAGNTLNDGIRSYQYNQAGRLINTQSTTVEYNYQYNFLGQRTHKQWQSAESNQNDNCKVVEVIKNVNVRSEPDKYSTKVGYLQVGQKYVDTGQEGNWRQIWYQNKQRWVYGRGYLEVSTGQCFKIANTLTGNVNVRASDSKYSEKRGTAPEGSVWVLDSIHGSWLSFWYDAELSFVHSNYTVLDEINNHHERYYQYDVSGMLIAELDGNGETLIEYIYLNGKRTAFVVANEIYFIHTNHLDAPIAITNSAAEVVWSGYYTPFGKLIETKNELTVEMALRFPGQYADAETGLHYNYFRDYDPELGRYIQSDPIGLAGGINTYGYVGGNPVNYIDPFGLAKICTRPLNGLGKFRTNGASNLNLGVFHEQILYKDGTNSGFSGNGLFADGFSYTDPDTSGYSCKDKEYDDALMKKAEERAKISFDMKNYNVITNNCQDYVDEVINQYYNVLADQNRHER
ncbi:MULTISPECIES: RHS repeat-associated core domain-containing protein [Pseudoalteromonas]|uniref:RHS repeat-associated core domain-containing protein n=1 Tax=Pseudoalteromonas TaxID=53246 RepID=UPI0015822475|nr:MULTISPECIES: RHS repeat-associated core domain-containing protein [Pseudoalteromonas]MDI4650714.1 RHS domain-containing protein [Pseudoalteromonas shioyasakiensis]NUJ37135.1 hypothetical protein [Pseudoalteromonas sp. 0303]